MLFQLRKCRICLLTVLLLTASAAAGAVDHIVSASETIYGLSQRYRVPMSWIVRVNNLEDRIIHPGQELTIPTGGVGKITVMPGDTVSALALEFGVSQESIVKINGLTKDVLRAGQSLTIPAPTPEGVYRVLPGDTMLGIASAHGITVEQLQRFNLLEGSIIHPGSLLRIAPPRPDGHRVSTGESLWSIADRYEVAHSDLALWNGLEDGAVIHPGDLLTLYSGLNPTEALKVNKASLEAQILPTPPVEDLPREGEYYFDSPDRKVQPSTTYWEEPSASSLTDYRRASRVLRAFKAETEAMPVLGNELAGWSIVIDPGHGGLDPGAIVTVIDGNGNPVVVTEDEYVYDISLRLSRILERRGASVFLTVLAPDHHVRAGLSARQTFVHRKNEVYHSAEHNSGAGWRPVGTTAGLDLRKKVAALALRESTGAGGKTRSLFISVHADNTPSFPPGTAVLFDGANDEEVSRSKSLAATLAPHLGAGSFVRRQSLRVLQDNPADAAVLIEARNIHYPRNAWALRSVLLREQDAQMMASGILAWAAKN